MTDVRIRDITVSNTSPFTFPSSVMDPSAATGTPS